MALSMSLMTHSQPAPALLYQHVKEPGDCTVATRVHSSIPYGDSGLLIVVGMWRIGLRSLLLLYVCCSYGCLLRDATYRLSIPWLKRQRTSQLAAYVIFAYGCASQRITNVKLKIVYSHHKVPSRAVC